MVSEEEYKQAKIDFVSHLSGSNKTDLLAVFAVAAICSLFHRTVSPLLPQNTLWKFLLEMLYMHDNYFLSLLQVWTIATYYAMMLMTCLAILAVDFTIFPRKFAKTETYGISVMDMGVGCVVLSGALVSRQARAVALPAEKGEKIRGRLYYAWGAVKSSLPLVILGLVRIALTKSTNYQEHVSEYGVHWNFFFTLGAVALFTALVNVPARFSAVIGLAIACGYQLVLSNYGLKEYIINHPRETIISANKEGLCSIFGYLSIYLVGVQLGNILFMPRRNLLEWKRDAIALTICTVIAFSAAFASETYVDGVSRRMANLTYVLYTISYTMYTLTSCLVVSIMVENVPSTILSAINRNQLFFFLLGNITTGLVNISVYTLYAPPTTAFTIVSLYITNLCVIVVFLDKKNKTIRIQ